MVCFLAVSLLTFLPAVQADDDTSTANVLTNGVSITAMFVTTTAVHLMMKSIGGRFTPTKAISFKLDFPDR